MKMKTNFIKGTLVLACVALFAASPASAKAVKGFRSVDFGAKEPQLLSLAAKDLGIQQKDFSSRTDDMLGVKILTAKLPSFDPLKLPATINYILGYKCKCLTQVSIVWDMPGKSSTDMRKEAMRGVAALIGKFSGDGWNKDEMIFNRLPKEAKIGEKSTIIFFRAQNKNGGAITLAGAPVMMEKGKKDQKELVANIDNLESISLIYEDDATHPDINRVDVSGF